MGWRNREIVRGRGREGRGLFSFQFGKLVLVAAAVAFGIAF